MSDMTGEDALEELVDCGWMRKREDGWFIMTEKPVTKEDIPYYADLIFKVAIYTVSLHGELPRIRVTSGPPNPFGRMYKLNDAK